MRLDVFNVDDFVEINHLEEITSPVLFQHGIIPDPKGLISNDIFGLTTKSRKETFAYIDLHAHFFHPHVYKTIRRMFRNIDKIINGEETYTIDSEGRLQKDEDGETGIEFLYTNWNKLNFTKPNNESADDTGMSKEWRDLVKNLKRDEIFMTKQIVIPAFYRDIKSSADSNGGTTDDINNLYVRLIRLVSLIKNQDLFEFQFHKTNFNIQTTMVAIYDFFKSKLERKNGMIRKYLMGKNVDRCTRTVITNPSFHADRPEDMITSFEYVSVPLAQICSLAYPFIVKWIKDFFERAIIDEKNSKSVYRNDTKSVITVKLVDPESVFTDKYIEKLINTFIRDPESRFNKIELPTELDKKVYMHFSGVVTEKDPSETSTIIDRPMTWTDLLYLAAEDSVKDKHVLITRYPVNNEYNIFIGKIRVTATTDTVPMMVNGYMYKLYPKVDLSIPRLQIPALFNDATQFSNSYLPGIDGDYDGDQTTIKIIYTQEANEECEKFMYEKSNFINSGGNNIRKVGKELAQSMYVLTKEPFGTYKPLTKEEKEYFCKLNPKDITFTKLVEWFGNTVDNSGNQHNVNANKSKFNVSDTLTLYPSDYKLIKDTSGVKTTLGRLIFNKVFLEGIGFDSFIDYQNDVLFAKKFGEFEGKVTAALKEDVITTKKMIEYINLRDWFGMQLHAVITTSFTAKVLKVPPNVKKLKKKLLEENKEALKNGDNRVIENIEKELIDATLKELNGDIGLDLFESGARGSVGNHLKNILLSRGAIANPVTGKYDIIENSLLDGLDKKDFTPHSNTIVTGTYPKSIGTAVSGYLAKQVLSSHQSEMLGPEGCDCGSNKTIDVKLTASNIKDYEYRYIKEGQKLILLSPDVIKKYIGKTVKMRTVMYCKTVGKEGYICSKCAGEFYYKMGKYNIGLVCKTPISELTQLSLQKFHDNVIKTQQIDPDDLLL